MTATIKIAHIIEHARGGTATYLSDLLAYAETDGRFEHLIVAERTSFPTELALARVPVRFYDMERRGRSIVHACRAVRVIVREERPALVHTHGSFAGVIGRIATLGLGVSRVHCAHGWPFTQRAGRLRTGCFVVMEWLLSRVTDVVVNVSRTEAETARRFRVTGSLGDRTIRHSTRDLGQLEERPTAGIHVAGKTNMLFAGRFDRQKGLDRLLRAWSDVQPRNIVLHVYGDFDRERGVVPADGGGDVRFHGWVDRRTVLEAMQVCEAFVMPSRWEGFGLAAIEAMSQGSFLLVSNAGALPELVVHGVNGLIFDSDDELRDMLRRVDALSPDEIRSTARLNRDIFDSGFRWPRAQCELFEVYGSLIPESERVRARLDTPSDGDHPATPVRIRQRVI